jgi:hypothetical protein
METAMSRTNGSDFIAPNSQRAIDEAARLGLDVVFPADNELQIDIDSDADYSVFCEHLGILDRHYGAPSDVVEKPSRSGGERRHITVTLHHKVTNTERIMLQALLGSDRKREILSLLQERDGDAHPTLFLERTAQPLLGTAVAVAQLTEGGTQ